ncbi:MAG: DUF1015 domain-containing protein [Proteobacteria bacterium]|nr:DUF1015 domain-containing protein [Pseudomonadota bacterium]MBU4296207.1 DUF1015 domain-containing protein [Pseudomonadota bacterium]MCG2748613.1 DUF1015 domain-containing protein [Desulfobulbaceae bacterium]
MAKIVPFRGLRFNPEKIDRMEDVVTPPYDVIDEKAQAALLSKNPYNMIQLDLTKHAGVAPAAGRYEGAKNLFDRWQEECVLIRDKEPAIYLYHIRYNLPNGRTFTRKGLVCLVGLAEFDQGIVKPHEKTFRSVTDDRLKLIDTCQAQFSQVFSIYSDENGEIMAALEGGCPKEPLYSVEDQDGCRHTLWAVTDPQVLAKISAAFQDKPLYIADGHHRYTTALQLREMMAKRQGSVAEDSPYNHVMMYLCPMEDPGLSVLPTHRLVYLPEKTGADELVARMGEYFDIEEVGGGSRETLIEQVLGRMEEKEEQQTVFGMYEPKADRCFLLSLKPGVMAGAVGHELPPALQELDVVVLSDLVVERLLGLSHERCDNEGLIAYYSDPDNALDSAVKVAAQNGDRSPILFLMNHTPVAQVKKIADEDLIMPHKSTYFYPKILTGLLINRLVANESVA